MQHLWYDSANCKETLKYHLAEHTGSYAYKCGVCGKGFSQKCKWRSTRIAAKVTSSCAESAIVFFLCGISTRKALQKMLLRRLAPLNSEYLDFFLYVAYQLENVPKQPNLGRGPGLILR